jgi:hypothetical protein
MDQVVKDSVAAAHACAEIVKILAPLTPNELKHAKFMLRHMLGDDE